MAKKAVFLFMLFLLPAAFAVEDVNFFTKDFLVLDVEMTAKADLVETGPSPYLEFVTAEYEFYPKQSGRQDIISMSYSPQPKQKENNLLFTWQDPKLRKIDLTINSKIKTKNIPPLIREKVAYPIKNLPPETITYTQPKEIIDLNGGIKSVAQELAEGEDDLVVVVDKIAAWTTENIKYDLSTVTAEASQKSSWVLKNRIGVCDELTALFISMVRSLGIPARFVAGISYTNSPLFAEKWGPHGWAEVYFPGYGWVPYDPTYGEYGYIDPTHITAKIDDDAGKISTKYSWRGKDIDLQLRGLKTNVKVEQVGGEINPFVGIAADIVKKSTGFGSYNLVKATVKNNIPFYQSFDVYLAKTEKLENIDANKKHVLLRPDEEKELLWVIKVQDNLEKDYYYNFPITVYTQGAINGSSSFTVTEEGHVFSLSDIERIHSRIFEEEEKIYTKELELKCKSDKDEYYQYEEAYISCSLDNQGNAAYSSLDACLGNDCMVITIKPGEKKEFKFRTKFDEEVNEVVTVEGEGVMLSEFLSYDVKGVPRINIADLEYPKETRYKETHTLKFTLEKASSASPQNVVVTVGTKGLEQEFTINQLNEDKVYDLEFSASDLSVDDNEFSIVAEFEDINGKKYKTEKSFVIKLVDVTFMQRAAIFIKDIGKSVAELF